MQVSAADKLCITGRRDAASVHNALQTRNETLTVAINCEMHIRLGATGIEGYMPLEDCPRATVENLMGHEECPVYQKFALRFLQNDGPAAHQVGIAVG